MLRPQWYWHSDLSLPVLVCYEVVGGVTAQAGRRFRLWSESGVSGVGSWDEVWVWSPPHISNRDR